MDSEEVGNDEQLTWSILLSISCTLPSTPIILLSNPSTLLPMLCVIFNSSAAAILASSCVSLSNFRTASSISVFPINFFRYLSDKPSLK